MLHRLNELVEQRTDFAFETTLATRFYSKWLASLGANGYNVHIVFLWLNSPELAVERVAARVRYGGHDIPEETIRRRYVRGLENFFMLYLPFADSWQMFDASGNFPAEVAFGGKISGKTTIDEALWQRIEK